MGHPSRALIPLTLAAILGGCTGKGGGGSGVRPNLQLLSPASPTAVVDATNLTVEVLAEQYTSIDAVIPGIVAPVIGVKNDTTFLIYDLAMAPGDNPFELVGKNADGTEVRLAMNLKRTDSSGSSLRMVADPLFSEVAPAQIALHLTPITAAPPAEVWVDALGDGIIDSRKPYATPVPVQYATTGTYKPRVFVKTQDNQIVSIPAEHSPVVRVLEPTMPDPARSYLGVGNQPADLDYEPGAKRLFVLLAADRAVKVFAQDRSLVRSIALPGVVDPSGIALDEAANLYVADKGGHKILKLLAPNYTPDPLVGPSGAFGVQGSGDGQLQGPLDVTTEGSGDALKIFVADTGNKRVQRYNRAGVFEAKYDGSNGGGAAFTGPRGLCRIPAGGIAALESQRIAYLSRSGEVVGETAGFTAAIGLGRNWHSGGFVIADQGAVRLHALDGTMVRKLTFGTSGTFDSSIVIPDPVGGLLVTASRTSRDLLAAVLKDDSAGKGPLDIVNSFLLALKNGDVAGARNLVLPLRRSAFDAVASDPNQWARIQGEIGTITNLSLGAQDASRAFVSGQRTVASKQAPVEFVVARSEDTGLWYLTSF